MQANGYWHIDSSFYEKGETWRKISKRYRSVHSKVEPIDRVINECRRRADDAWWDGKDEEAKLRELEKKLYEQDKEEGILWVPNF